MIKYRCSPKRLLSDFSRWNNLRVRGLTTRAFSFPLARFLWIALEPRLWYYNTICYVGSTYITDDYAVPQESLMLFSLAEEKIEELERRIAALEAERLPTPEPEPGPKLPDAPTPEPGQPRDPSTDGLWLSREEIMRLPASPDDRAFMAVLSAAESDWGAADLSSNNSKHDVLTYAGALIAVRLDDQKMRDKVVAAIESAMRSKFKRALELSRGLQSYIIAADIIGYRTAEFEQWIERAVTASIPDHSAPGDAGLYGTALYAPNNWGGHARASLAAAALYLGRRDWLNAVTKAHLEFIGVPVFDPCLVYTSTNWHADPTFKAGVNRKGATISGINVSGVMPEDWRRAAGFQWPPMKSVYMWEGVQGFLVTAVLLDRAGMVPLSDGDHAVKRVFDALYGKGEAALNPEPYVNPASGDDCWTVWVANRLLGTDYETSYGSPGKGLGFAEWTHA